MSISATRMVISTSGQTFEIPGDFSAQQLVSMYGASVPGLTELQATTATAGSVRTVTFSPRQGSKG